PGPPRLSFCQAAETGNGEQSGKEYSCHHQIYTGKELKRSHLRPTACEQNGANLIRQEGLFQK
ncbi:MAG: hypothetical protein HN623_10000, partial [Bdellovibrionales bacterium]|nr:hypothetical protein [Bdellovibrionales bacterium]